MHTRHLIRQVFALVMGWVLCIILGGCQAPSPPPAPSVSNSSNAESSRDSSTSDDEDGDLGDLDADGFEGGEDGGTDDSSYRGADVGDEEIQQRATKCIRKGKYFDRTADNGAGDCTEMSLAKTACTTDGIKDVLRGDAKSKFEAALAGSYADLKFDQCVDCPPGGSAAICRNSAGDYRSGTTFVWVSYANDTLTIKTMNYSKRFE